MYKYLWICMSVLLGHFDDTADYIYMGGGYGFAPIGSDEQVLALNAGRQALLPVNLRPGQDMLFTAHLTSPLDKAAKAGIGFILATPDDTTRLVITNDKCADPVYPHDRLTLTHTNKGVSVNYPLISTEAPCLHEAQTIFTLSLEDSLLTVRCGRNGTLLWQGETAVPTAVGCFAPGNSHIEVKRAMLITESDDDEYRSMDSEEVRQRLLMSSDPYSGYWTLLDNTFDTSYLKPGGDYNFALLPNGNGYELIYVAGANVSPSAWSEGMTKATLTGTQLPGLYNVTWLDAEHMPLPDTGTWQFLGTDICRITFPALNSTFRLHRISSYERNLDTSEARAQ